MEVLRHTRHEGRTVSHVTRPLANHWMMLDYLFTENWIFLSSLLNLTMALSTPCTSPSLLFPSRLSCSLAFLYIPLPHLLPTISISPFSSPSFPASTPLSQSPLSLHPPSPPPPHYLNLPFLFTLLPHLLPTISISPFSASPFPTSSPLSQSPLSLHPPSPPPPHYLNLPFLFTLLPHLLPTISISPFSSPSFPASTPLSQFLTLSLLLPSHLLLFHPFSASSFFASSPLPHFLTLPPLPLASSSPLSLSLSHILCPSLTVMV